MQASLDTQPTRRIIALTSWRFLTIGLLALWRGGFTFYGAVVIHIAERVLASHLPIGFITQRVRLNLIGAITLLVLLVHLLLARRTTFKPFWLTLASTWSIMTITLILLLALHPMLDRLLDPQSREILDADAFRGLHQSYLIISTIQGAAALGHLWLLLADTIHPGAISNNKRNSD